MRASSPAALADSACSRAATRRRVLARPPLRVVVEDRGRVPCRALAQLGAARSNARSSSVARARFHVRAIVSCPPSHVAFCAPSPPRTSKRSPRCRSLRRLWHATRPWPRRQLREQQVHRGPARLGSGRQTPQDCRSNPARHVVDGRHSRWRVVDELGRQLLGRARGVGPLPPQRLVQRDAKRILIATGVGDVAGELFRSHVRWRAQQRTGAGELSDQSGSGRGRAITGASSPCLGPARSPSRTRDPRRRSSRCPA